MPVEKVFYSGLKGHAGCEIQRKQATGDGAVLSFRLAEGHEPAAFCDSLSLFDLAVSLGGVESLVCHPSSMTHETYSKELQREIGISENLLRLSVGIEHIDDLLEDLDSALGGSKK